MEPKTKQREPAIKAEGVVNGPLRECVTVSLEEGKGGRTRSPPVPESEMARSATQRAWLPPLGALLLLLLFARRAAAALEDGTPP